MPWILATHRVEDVPDSATHALVLDKGRVVYRGALRNAPLAKWLSGRGLCRQSSHRRTGPALGAMRSAIDPAHAASVYLTKSESSRICRSMSVR